MATMPTSVQLESAPARTAPRAVQKKKLLRRRVKDHSQALRLALQAAFLLLNAVIGVKFFLFVRYFESGGGTARIPRPPGVDGWLPIGGMMNLKYFLFTGEFPRVHPAAMFLLVAFLLISILFRKAFCGWLCPVGTFIEGLWKLGRKFLKTNWRLPRWLDIPLRGLKYVLLALFVYAVAGMSIEGIRAFLGSPYGVVADVEMLNFFRFMGATAAITLGVLILLSMLIKNFWCRYLCPYGALLGLGALASPSRIRRTPDRCIDCAKCAVACPALLPVDKLITIKSAECTACMECVAACPAEGALQMSLPGRRKLPAWGLAAGVAAIFLGVVLLARLNGAWQTDVPDAVYFQLVPRAMEFIHP